jgi:hypothetical protein
VKLDRGIPAALAAATLFGLSTPMATPPPLASSDCRNRSFILLFPYFQHNHPKRLGQDLHSGLKMSVIDNRQSSSAIVVGRKVRPPSGALKYG